MSEGMTPGPQLRAKADTMSMTTATTAMVTGRLKILMMMTTMMPH